MYLTTQDVKLRNFQYRLLLNKIFTNDTLYKWKIVHSPLCEYCKEIQSVVHLLIDCEHSAKIWKDLESILEQKNVLRWDKWYIMTNNVHPKPTNVINTIVLLVKFTLFARKCQKVQRNFSMILKTIKEYYNVKKYNAYYWGKLTKFTDKWNPMLSLINNCI